MDQFARPGGRAPGPPFPGRLLLQRPDPHHRRLRPHPPAGPDRPCGGGGGEHARPARFRPGLRPALWPLLPPPARFLFSRRAVIAPFRAGSAFLFRIVDGGSNQLIEVEASPSLSLQDPDTLTRSFVALPLERSRINLFRPTGRWSTRSTRSVPCAASPGPTCAKPTLGSACRSWPSTTPSPRPCAPAAPTRWRKSSRARNSSRWPRAPRHGLAGPAPPGRPGAGAAPRLRREGARVLRREAPAPGLERPPGPPCGGLGVAARVRPRAPAARPPGWPPPSGPGSPRWPADRRRTR